MEGLEVAHPLDGELVWRDVRLVEGQQHGQLGLVQDAERVEHVGHEDGGLGAARRVHHEAHHRGEGRGKKLGDDAPRGRPREDLNLPGRVHQHVLERGLLLLLCVGAPSRALRCRRAGLAPAAALRGACLFSALFPLRCACTSTFCSLLARLCLRSLAPPLRRPLLENVHHLVEARGEEVEARHDGAVGPQVVLPHDLLVIDGVAHVEVAPIWHGGHRRVQVERVGGRPLGLKVRRQGVHQTRLARACHAHHQHHHRLATTRGRRRRGPRRRGHGAACSAASSTPQDARASVLRRVAAATRLASLLWARRPARVTRLPCCG